MEENLTGSININECELESKIDSKGEIIGSISTNENLKGVVLTNIEVKGEISIKEGLTGSLGSTTFKLSTNKHNELINRDLPNQHPINAIEGLKEELLSIKNNQSSTNLSIKNLNSKINNKIRTVKEIPNDLQVGEYIFLEKGV